jgi:hypothetical protein
MKTDTLIVCSCDQNYFPLVKGLLLSILDSGPLPAGLGLALIDIGCDVAAVRWLRDRGARVCVPDTRILGGLADAALGYRRSQTCRPVLPKLFPDAAAFIWIDCDAWVQDSTIFQCLRSAVTKNPDQLFIAPECHYSYTPINADCQARHQEMFSYYEPTFGAEVAARMCRRLTLNSGLFAMAANNPIWGEWEREVRRLYVEQPGDYAPLVRHMAEQIALNVIAARESRVTLLDPLYNYVCLWNPPFRDVDGVVRVALPPYLPIGLIHLAGGWIRYGAAYARRGLLYRSGSYLTDADEAILFQERQPLDCR